MQEAKFPHPYLLRAINTIGAALRTLHLPIAEFKEGVLCQAASKQTGLSDFGDPYFREGLVRVLESAEHDARLHFMGRVIFYNLILLQLSNRLQLVETTRRRPEIFQRPLLPPIIIIGLPRSGTTLLHRLLALDPAHRGVPLWEMTRPVPPLDARPDLRRQAAEQAHQQQLLLAPNMDHKHYTGLEEPEECMIMLGLTFVNTMFWLFGQVFGYMEWVMEQDLFQKKYQDYRCLLQLLQSASPGKRLILKSPEHTPKIDVLLELIPQALVIQTHRDPVAVLPSTNSLIYSFQVCSADHLDLQRMAETNLRLLEWDLACNRAGRRKCPGQILDLTYDQLVADPLETVREIYRRFQLGWSYGFERSLQEYVEQNPKDKHGSHAYRPEDFGQTSQEIAERFSEYRQDFGYA